MSRVSIKDLDIGYSDTLIIKKLSLDVEDGEFLVLLGPSGCGKSTLLHSIAGLVDVADGSIHIDHTDVTWADPKDRGIGMVFQSYALYPTMTVERNMSFGLRISGIAKDEIERRVSRAAAMLHLTELLQRKPSQLSGGQRQRVAIGRALVRDAGVYLFDEPLSNLDAKLRSELRRELKRLHKELGSTMIYVTHDQVEAMTLATRIVVMRKGEIQQIGAPDFIYEQPANLFVAGFLGSPSMNFVEGQLERVNGEVLFRAPAMTLDVSDYGFAGPVVSGHRVVLGFRPEHVTLVDVAQTGFTAQVSVTEPMGDHQIIWLDLQGIPISLSADKQQKVEVDQAVRFDLERERISLFDQNSGVRV